MNRPLLVRTFACVALLALPARADDRAPLTVRVVNPTAGLVDGDLVVALDAEVSDPTVRLAMLTVNGTSYEVPVEAGHIQQSVVAVPGNNRVLVSVSRGGVVARDAITFFLRGEPVELMVVLGWASRGEILDLWTREPSGETCKWDHRETRSGGRLLDFSHDAIGFGSQAFVLPTVVPGRYRVKVHYWGATASDDDGSFALADALDSLDTLDDRLAQATGAARLTVQRERDVIVRRIDRWAQPVAPQTPVHAEVVLFANSPHERRWRFDRIAHRTGQLETLGDIEVSAEMIRAARAVLP